MQCTSRQHAKILTDSGKMKVHTQHTSRQHAAQTSTRTAGNVPHTDPRHQDRNSGSIHLQHKSRKHAANRPARQQHKAAWPCLASPPAGGAVAVQPLTTAAAGRSAHHSTSPPCLPEINPSMCKTAGRRLGKTGDGSREHRRPACVLFKKHSTSQQVVYYPS